MAIFVNIGTDSKVIWEKGTITLEELLFQLGLGDFDFYSLINLLLVALLMIGVVLDGGREERVDERCLSQARFTSNLNGWQQVSKTHSEDDLGP